MFECYNLFLTEVESMTTGGISLWQATMDSSMCGNHCLMQHLQDIFHVSLWRASAADTSENLTLITPRSVSWSVLQLQTQT